MWVDLEVWCDSECVGCDCVSEKSVWVGSIDCYHKVCVCVKWEGERERYVCVGVWVCVCGCVLV